MTKTLNPTVEQELSMDRAASKPAAPDVDEPNEAQASAAALLDLTPQQAGTQTLLRGLAILEAAAGGARDLRSIGAALGTTRSTTHRLVSSLVQAVASDEMRGRVMSVYNVAFRGGMPVGSLILGKLIPIFSAPVIMGWSGGLLALLGLYFLVVQRRVAQL